MTSKILERPEAAYTVAAAAMTQGAMGWLDMANGFVTLAAGLLAIVIAVITIVVQWKKGRLLDAKIAHENLEIDHDTRIMKSKTWPQSPKKTSPEP